MNGKCRGVISALGAVACLGAIPSAQATPPAYQVTAISPIDQEHTRDDGYRYSYAFMLNGAGQVIGLSDRFNGSDWFGYTAWLYDGATTINIGLIDAEHTRSDGYRDSGGGTLNEAGRVVGSSMRYSGADEFGYDAWLYDGATTSIIGPTDAEHTRDDGYRGSAAHMINEAGLVVGHSERFSGAVEKGLSTWLYHGTTVTLGLVDAEHTRDDGYRYNYAVELNQAGQVAGVAERYLGSEGHGFSAWLYNGTATVNVGLTDAEHTLVDGYRVSRADMVNDAGQVMGSSDRFNAFGPNGLSVWLYNGTTTVNVGLTDAAHTRIDGYRQSNAYGLNQAGQVIGNSDRFSGAIGTGSTAWLYDGTTTRDIGLTDTEHAGENGVRSSTVWHLNEAGQAIGESTCYDGLAWHGQSAWLYDGATTRNIGLTDAVHTGTDGIRYSGVSQLNQSGQVTGFSHRMNGPWGLESQSAWLYDPTLDFTFPLVLSVRSDGYASSQAEYLGEDGLVLGSYELFDETDASLGNRAFFFTMDDGLHDLGSLVEGGLTGAGWSYLANAIRGNGDGQILGAGLLAGMPDGEVVFLASPVTLAVLTWDGSVGESWGSPHWSDGSDLVSPAGGEQAVVPAGLVRVEDDVTGSLAARSLQIEGGVVEVVAGATLETLLAATVTEGILLVDGALLSKELTVESLGVLAGSGTITAPTITIGGVLSPGASLGAPMSGGDMAMFQGMVANQSTVPEPGAWALLLAGLLGITVGLCPPASRNPRLRASGDCCIMVQRQID